MSSAMLVNCVAVIARNDEVVYSFQLILYYIWIFVYFLCFQTPPKRRVVRRQNLARRWVTTTSRTSVGICVYRQLTAGWLG